MSLKNKNVKAYESDEIEIEQTGAQKVVGFISDILFYLLIVAILVAAVMFASSRTPDKSILGYRYYDVLTGSMEPTYSVGDLIFVKLTDPDDVKVGDPITFNPGGTEDSYLTHRVVEKLENYQGTGITCFKTRGDANDSDDPFIIDESRVIGTVKFRIPFVGYAALIAQNYYIPIIAFIILFSVFMTLLRKYTSISAEIKALEREDEK